MDDDDLLGIWAGNAVFAESAVALREALALLGCCDVALCAGNERCPEWSRRPLWILVGVTHMPEAWPLPRRYVVYQMEQLSSPWLTPRYLATVGRAVAVWEFAPRHVSFWRSRGLDCDLVPLSTAPLDPTPGPADIDVLFYGSGNERRRALGHQLEASLPGYRIRFHLDFDLFGANRDRAVDAARVVLNLHFYEDAALEVHRINYLLSRGKCVLSEPSADAQLDAFYAQAVAFAATADLATAALTLLRDDATRAALERRALQFASHLPTHCATHLHPALANLGAAVAASSSSSLRPR